MLAMASALESFLRRNSILSTTQDLPLVHSTSAHVMKKILADKEIKISRCSVFKEDLNYFFVGRPAYKRAFPTEGEYWELPVCLVTKFELNRVKRIFPLDSGGFNAETFPDYISMMNLEEYECASVIDSPRKIIGSFFVNNEKYMRLKPRARSDFERRFEVDVLDDEIKALYKLILDNGHKFDDRRFAIEVQMSESVHLTKENTIACIFPEDYMTSSKFMGWLQSLEAIALPYQTYPFKSEFYYHAIYQKTFELYKELRLIR